MEKTPELSLHLPWGSRIKLTWRRVGLFFLVVAVVGIGVVLLIFGQHQLLHKL